MIAPEIVRVETLPEPWRELWAVAVQARERAHTPYSRFQVGAAVRCGSGRTYVGCNIENSSYGLTVCAERVAIWKAVSEGERTFEALAVVSEAGGMPCGACRQVLNEFAADPPVLIADLVGNAWLTSLGALLPAAFPRVWVKDAANALYGSMAGYDALDELEREHKQEVARDSDLIEPPVALPRSHPEQE